MTHFENSGHSAAANWGSHPSYPAKSKTASDTATTHHYHHPSYSSSQTTPAPYIPNFTTIVHDEEGAYEHVPTRDIPSGSVSSRPEYLYSNRTSMTSSGSTFSQLDSPADLAGYSRPGHVEQRPIVSRPEPAAMRALAADEMHIAPAGGIQAQRQNDAHVAFRESKQMTGEKRASRLESAYTRNHHNNGGSGGHQRDSQSSSNVYVYQGYSEKEDDGWRTTYPACIEEPTPKPWRVMVYLTLGNPFICAANAFYTIFAVIAAAVMSPFRRNPQSSDTSSHHRSKFAAYLVSQLLPLHEFHFRLLTARPMHIVDSRGASPLRLALVHFVSPLVAILASLSGVCVFFAWIYGLILSDSGDVTSMEEWIIVKWEAFLMKAFVVQ